VRIVDSVTYLAQKPRNTDVERLFYLYHFRIRLSVPIDWRWGFRPPPGGPIGGIELRQPEKGEVFSFLISPLGTAKSAEDHTVDMTKERRQSKLEGAKCSVPCAASAARKSASATTM